LKRLAAEKHCAGCLWDNISPALFLKISILKSPWNKIQKFHIINQHKSKRGILHDCPGVEQPAMSEFDLLKVRRKLDQKEAERLSPTACLSSQAVRQTPDAKAEKGMRQQFAVDADRVLHSLAYTRYIDKTQVFSLLDNDHITHRVLHVQLVSKIARSIGRLLGLNEDLIEAISLAHDIGHPPFGHDGESFLSEKCTEYGLGPFLHNVQSVHFLEKVESRGEGLNLSLQVLDGVLCHDGEVHSSKLEPQRHKSFASLDAELKAKQADPKHPLTPMTLEGCVVRITDTIAYIGRDFEDAIIVKLIKREDLPAEISDVLGNTNGTMVYRLVEDLIQKSIGREYVGFSPRIGRALKALKDFNYAHIYKHPAIKTEHAKLRRAIHSLFDQYMLDLEGKSQNSMIFTEYLDDMCEAYVNLNHPALLVRDFLAGMTDAYLLRRYREMVWPQRLPYRFDQECQ
jgi:dGTPase